MPSSGPSWRVVLVVLALCLVGSSPTYSQSPIIFSASKSFTNRTTSGAWLAKCEAISLNSRAVGHSNEENEWPATGNSAPGDAISGDFSVPQALCLDSDLPAAAPKALADNPCSERAAGASIVQVASNGGRGSLALACDHSADTVLAELSALGKEGAKIARARKEVLEILRSENACTEWFETKDATPAGTFQSISFLLDRHGPQDIFETAEASLMVSWRQPYVASATQDGGAHTAITINIYGAFYRPQGNVMKVLQQGGPLRADGTGLLTVGSYQGATLAAQMVTLLHEFGHIIDLLPDDADNLDGKSVRNTSDVLSHCRGEVEARVGQAKLTAKR